MRDISISHFEMCLYLSPPRTFAEAATAATELAGGVHICGVPINVIPGTEVPTVVFHLHVLHVYALNTSY